MEQPHLEYDEPMQHCLTFVPGVMRHLALLPWCDRQDYSAC